jgi:hypothetical protein
VDINEARARLTGAIDGNGERREASTHGEANYQRVLRQLRCARDTSEPSDANEWRDTAETAVRELTRAVAAVTALREERDLLKTLSPRKSKALR